MIAIGVSLTWRTAQAFISTTHLRVVHGSHVDSELENPAGNAGVFQKANVRRHRRLSRWQQRSPVGQWHGGDVVPRVPDILERGSFHRDIDEYYHATQVLFRPSGMHIAQRNHDNVGVGGHVVVGGARPRNVKPEQTKPFLPGNIFTKRLCAFRRPCVKQQQFYFVSGAFSAHNLMMLQLQRGRRPHLFGRVLFNNELVDFLGG